MPSTIAARPAQATDRGPGPALAPVLAAVVLVVYRLSLTLLDRTELSTDEAQYWFWGQRLEFGAYSKPPLIGWIIRLSTDLLGQSVWAVRLPAVLLHAATAAAIFACARRIAPHPVPIAAAVLYLVMPAVALGSSVMTTDTPLLLAAALALLAQMRLAETRFNGHRAPSTAMLLGLALGVGILAKHAMLFWLVGCPAAASLDPALRPGKADALLALAVMLAVVTPHLLWLGQHGFITFQHVQAITGYSGPSLLRPLRFFGEQLLVAGPVVFLAMGFARLRDPAMTGLAVLAAVPLLIVLAQAVRGPVLANWAVLYLVPGSILAALWLVRHPVLLRLSLLLGLAISLALPLAKVLGTDLHRPDGRLLLARYLGHAEISHWALTTARATGAQVIIAHDRDLLADLSWFSSGTGLGVRAIPPKGRPAHQWEMTAPFAPAKDGAPLLILRASDTLPCPDARTLARHTAPPGFAEGDILLLLRLPDPTCLLATASHEDTE